MALPSIATQNWSDFESNMSESKQFNNKKNRLQLLLHKIKRLIGISIDKVLSLLEHL